MKSPHKKPSEKLLDDPKQWRVGRRTGQERWQLKYGSGAWRIMFEGDTLLDIVEWLEKYDIDWARISIVSGWPRHTLGQIVPPRTSP